MYILIFYHIVVNSYQSLLHESSMLEMSLILMSTSVSNDALGIWHSTSDLNIHANALKSDNNNGRVLIDSE